MNTLNDYLNATPAAQDEERARRGWKPRGDRYIVALIRNRDKRKQGLPTHRLNAPADAVSRPGYNTRPRTHKGIYLNG